MDSKSHFKKSNILIVDDLEDNLVAMVEALEGIDANLVTANSGEKALELMIDEEFAVVLMDVQMPRMGGFETAELMRKNKRTRGIPIIFVTAISKEQQYVFQGYEAGAVDYLFKPIETHILKSKIQIFLNIYQQKNTEILQTVSELRIVKRELKEKNQELSKLALNDPLTSIANRRQFETDLEKQIAYAKDHTDEQFAVIFLDLDDFKSINDTLGHPIGDQLLQHIGKLLTENTRKEDYQGRLGGDEFAIIVTHLNKASDALKTANLIKSVIDQNIEIDGHLIYTSFSMGIACYPSAGNTSKELMHNADIAMYHAKALGKNQICYFTDDLQDKYLAQLELETLIKEAVDQCAFELIYQPIFNLETKNPYGIEILLQCKHAKLQSIQPNVLMSIAENIGISETIGNWLINQALLKVQSLYDQGYDDLFFTINFSTKQLLHPTFFTKLNQAICQYSFPKKLLMLELNESALITFKQNDHSLLYQLNKLGINIILNKFGTGYSSLIKLQEIPFFALKIDASFIQGIGDNNSAEMIIKAIISVAKNLNIEIIAEGLQSDQQVKFLEANHCLFVQGNLFQSPLNAEQLTIFLEAYNE
ncbi:EAL domain-containing protein [Thiotrichales bacterium 19X7-9]|nr:EAL domain-containing protein [Thiotrichales bacterium 19X7-9]